MLPAHKYASCYIYVPTCVLSSFSVPFNRVPAEMQVCLGQVQRVVETRRDAMKFCRKPLCDCGKRALVVSFVYGRSACSEAGATTRSPL
ncbi:hypothetical protein GQ55_9G078100 [Panicum hallii var. hallii]|uniref:Uncharacterized protein n=1 Tax=Panicum hallii var. hallii TaxID=1504633 RepID=A0A2T7C127_9POAL|nr:hypothetical protein GQ55_9G078100 [Panicum hallii var. hallii]